MRKSTRRFFLRPWRFLARADWVLALAAVLVAAVGAMVQASIHGPGPVPTGHLIRLGAAAIAACLAAAWGAKRWRHMAMPLWISSVGLLVLVLVAGRATNHARRWLDLGGGFKLQPSELAKLAVLLVLARWFADRPAPKTIRELIRPACLVAIPAGLVVLQPDLGTALTFGPLFLAMAWFAGTSWRKLKWYLLVPTLLFPASLFLVRDYQLERIDVWLRQDTLTQEERADAGYHLWHAKLAVGSGGLTGYGWGQGPENRLDRLPERHNDFLFPVIAEEFGLVGASTFLFLYGWLALAALAASRRHRDPFTRFVVAGVGVHFGVHMVINVGVTLGLLPATGLPLPLVSWGGSSMLAGGLALGLALAVGASREPSFSDRAFEDYR